MRVSSRNLIFGAIAIALFAPSVAVASASPPPNPVMIAPSPDTGLSRSDTGEDIRDVVAGGEQAGATNSLEAVVIPVPSRAWDTVLRQYVMDTDETGLARFDYAGLKSNSEDFSVLMDYISHLESQNPDEMDAKSAIAYWANLYNAVTVKLIIDHYPVRSIRKIKSGVLSIGPWGKKLISVNGKRLSLDDVEHKILRRQFPSPLIHYMVNCASVGCPNLKDGIWRAETLETDREAAAKAFINSPRGVVVDGDDLTVSSIYKWFIEDFGGSKMGVLEHIKAYANPDLLAAIDAGAGIDDYDYDWSLNGTE